MGLFISVQSSVMNQIQALTNTTISKVLPTASSIIAASNPETTSGDVDGSAGKGGKEDVSKNEKDHSRRRALSEDEPNTELDGADEDEGSIRSSRSSQSAHTSATSESSDEEEVSEGEKESGKPEGKKQFDENEPPVPFRIIGQNAKFVDIAFEQLARIIKGDRIKEVMDALVIQTASLHPHPSHHYKDNREYRRGAPGSGRGVNVRERERERGGERPEKKRESTAERGVVGKDVPSTSKDESGKGPRVEKKDRKKPFPSDQGDEKKEWSKVDRGEKRAGGGENKRGPFPKRSVDSKKAAEKS
jgi:hypothetical protein